jgi:GNAT superfamily N-acetyltransferase
MDPVFTLTDEPDPTLKDRCRENFLADAAAKGVPNDYRTLAIHFERDGVLLGGLLGRTLRGWLYVENLALPQSELGRGYGTRLLAMAEEEAVRRSCIGVFLNTDAFMAPAFYEGLGYTEFGRLEGEDPRFTRIWFSKRFAA